MLIFSSAGKEKKNGGRKTDLLLLLLMIGFAAMTVVGGIFYFKSQKEYKAGDNAYADLAEAAIAVPKENTGQAHDVSPPGEETAFTVNFDALKAVNPQTVGWIRSDTGIIDYPVMRGEDNDWYLTHLPDGTTNKNGSLFMDFRCSADLSDRHTIIYGHNMRTGTMFGELVEYGKEGYYEAHPTLLLATPSGTYTLEAFSGYVIPGNSDIYQLDFADDESFALYLERIRKLSGFDSPVSVTEDDRIVTLSTCTYDYEDARYVLHCKLVPPQ